MYVLVDKIHNPKSENNGYWYVSTSDDCRKPFEMVYKNRSKKVCVEYAKALAEKPIISNGREYGCKF